MDMNRSEQIRVLSLVVLVIGIGYYLLFQFLNTGGDPLTCRDDGNDLITCISDSNIEEDELEIDNESLNPLNEEFDPVQEQGSNQSERGLADDTTFFIWQDENGDWRSHEEAIALYASVPNVLMLEHDIGDYEAGTLLSHFVDASEFENPGDENISFVYSLDQGETWSEDRSTIKINGADELLVVDPSLVQLKDGRLRLYFYDFSVSNKVEDGAGRLNFYSAISEDGINFAYEGASLNGLDIDGDVSGMHSMTDPEVVLFNDEWYMFFAVHAEDGGGIYYAKSDEGLEFDYLGAIGMQGIPGALVMNEMLYVYGCENGISQISSSDGETFDRSKMELIFTGPYCDPDPALLEDGSLVFVVKAFNAEDWLDPEKEFIMMGPPMEGEMNHPKPIN